MPARPRPSSKTADTPRPNRGLQLKVTLTGSKPPIWRRLVVPADMPLPDMHEVLQTAMGWQDCHLHLFRNDAVTFARRSNDYEPLGEDELRATLPDLVLGKGDHFVYEYDFGDGWEHRVVVEQVIEPHDGSVHCLAGKRACPPEDCGGVWGYEEMLAILADPGHEEYEERLEWCGELAPEAFEVELVEAMLQARFGDRKPVRRRAARNRRGRAR